MFYSIFELITDFGIFELIIIILTFSIEIFAIFVFFETIELNFCGLNLNLKKSIINRANNEIKGLLEELEEEEDEDNDISEGKYEDLKTITDNNSQY